ncbi:hypothetical protein MASR1M32_13620 [Rhodobacter sp.]
MLPHGFAPGELVRIGLTSVGAILGWICCRRARSSPNSDPVSAGMWAAAWAGRRRQAWHRKEA